MPEHNELLPSGRKGVGQADDFNAEYQGVPSDFVGHVMAEVGQALFVRVEHWPARYKSPKSMYPELVYPKHRVNINAGGVVKYAYAGPRCYWQWVR